MLHGDLDGRAAGLGSELRREEDRAGAGGTERGKVSSGVQKTQCIRPCPIERSQSLEQKAPVAFEAPANQLGGGARGQKMGDGGVGQVLALILSMTLSVTSRDLSTATISPSLALTSRMRAYPPSARTLSIASFTLPCSGARSSCSR